MDRNRRTKWHWLLTIACVFAVWGFNHSVVAEEEEAGISGWMRTDTDSLGTQIWFGASHTLGNFGIDSDIYVVGPTGEFDIGPSFTLMEGEDADLSVLPMIGLVFDFESLNVTTLVPQFYTYLAAGNIYFESWLQGFLASPFDDAGDDTFYTRNFVLYTLSDVLSIGPQAELTINLDTAEDEDSLANLAIGGRINLAYGESNTLGLFVGYETKEELREGNDGIVGRFTFVREW